jgi:hypothetical protein
MENHPFEYVNRSKLAMASIAVSVYRISPEVNKMEHIPIELTFPEMDGGKSERTPLIFDGRSHAYFFL